MSHNKKIKMSDIMIHFCCLDGKKNKEGLREVISKDIDDLGLTYDQAHNIVEEMSNAKLEHITSWLTIGSNI